MDRLKYDHTTITDSVKPMTSQHVFNETTVNVVANQGAKIGVIWAMLGIGSWSEAAAFLAFVLSALALTEYIWKKMLRPLLASIGVMKFAKQRVKLVEVEDTE